MGYAMAEAAIEAGHGVVLISGPVSLTPPRGAQLISVLTSDEMYDAVHRHVGHCDVLVMCAAVADYKPARVSAQKIKKRDETLSLELIPTRDILASLPQDRQFLAVGFAAETNDVEENARKKLRAKNLRHRCGKRCERSEFRNGKRGKRSDDFLSRRRNEENFARTKKNSRARAHKNICK